MNAGLTPYRSPSLSARLADPGLPAPRLSTLRPEMLVAARERRVLPVASQHHLALLRHHPDACQRQTADEPPHMGESSAERRGVANTSS